MKIACIGVAAGIEAGTRKRHIGDNDLSPICGMKGDYQEYLCDADVELETLHHSINCLRCLYKSGWKREFAFLHPMYPFPLPEWKVEAMKGDIK